MYDLTLQRDNKNAVLLKSFKDLPKIHTCLLFPSMTCMDISILAEMGKIDNETNFIIVDRCVKSTGGFGKVDFLNNIHKSIVKYDLDLNKFYFHLADLCTKNSCFNLDIPVDKFGKIDFAFFDFCGSLSFPIISWYKQYRHCFKSDANLFFTYSLGAQARVSARFDDFGVSEESFKHKIDIDVSSMFKMIDIEKKKQDVRNHSILFYLNQCTHFTLNSFKAKTLFPVYIYQDGTYIMSKYMTLLHITDICNDDNNEVFDIPVIQSLFTHQKMVVNHSNAICNYYNSQIEDECFKSDGRGCHNNHTGRRKRKLNVDESIVKSVSSILNSIDKSNKSNHFIICKLEEVLQYIKMVNSSDLVKEAQKIIDHVR